MTTALSIYDLPSVVRLLVGRAAPPSGDRPLRLRLSYLRRKPGRGIVAVYRTGPSGLVTLTIDEALLEGRRICMGIGDVRRAPVQGRWPGVVSIAGGAVSLLAFPLDPRLPRLAECCAVESRTETFRALEIAAREQLDDPRWELARTTAEPIRYKPGSRCVIRYRLAGRAPEHASVNVIAKLYRTPEDAHKVHLALRDLYREHVVRGATSLVPRPLGVLETAGLVISEEVRPTPVALAEIVGAAAIAAARVHSSNIRVATESPDSEAAEARRVRARAEVLAAHDGERAGDVLRVADRLASRLAATPPDAYRPTHGSFKPSQLLFAEGRRLMLTDLDHFDLADPARDIGYFLAYLRPSGLWYRRAGARQRFEAASAAFVAGYGRAARELGLSAQVTEGILDRSSLYEAALLLKIAARHANRLNSPRGGELTSILEEATGCLAKRRERVRA